MSEESGQKDPSMEEILGSIRKIITEDNAADAAEGQPPSGDDDDNVLELTEEIGGDDRLEPVLDSSNGDTAEPVAEDEDSRKEPVFDPALAAPESDEFKTFDADEPAAPEVPETPVEVGGGGGEGYKYAASAAPNQEGDAMATKPEDEQSGAPDAPAGKEELVSETVSVAATSALGELTKAVAEKTGKTRFGEGATIEDMVREMIRPMLREWLDEKLPGIVERLVRREIQNLADRAQDED